MIRLFSVLRLKVRIALRLLWLRIKHPPTYRFVRDYSSWIHRAVRAEKNGIFPATAANDALDRIGEMWGIHRETGESDHRYKARILKKYDTMEAPRR